jgi:glycerol-3-phosphate dehydrogenase
LLLQRGVVRHDRSLSPGGENHGMTRSDLLTRLSRPTEWDVAVIGGGATGLGVALDAAARGFSVVLLESHDFAKGTSSRATKLVHGGVRYLAQGNIALVREALHERSTLLRNAPHLAQPLAFVMPSYKIWETPFYGVGLKAYDALAGRAGLGPTEFLTRAQTLACLPTVRPEGLKGGVSYWDGQFDDARLALALARTAASRGALVVNYCPVEGLVHSGGKVTGLTCRDRETGRAYEVHAGCVINAAGVWVDGLRQQDGASTGRQVKPMVAPSQGVHIVVDREFLPGTHALMVPKTRDGRVLFGVPWLGKLILGTTDTPRADLALEPRPFQQELDFILGEAARCLTRAPGPADIRSMWVGLRPLVKPADEDGHDTKRLSREHTVLASPSGLVTVTGGKWTTYRAMAEDVLQLCFDRGLLPVAAAGVTANLVLVGGDGVAAGRTPLSEPQGLHSYGSEATAVLELPGAERVLGGGLTEAMVRFAARREYARTVEDVLARRWRTLFLDASLAASLAETVGEILQQETGTDPQVAELQALAALYLLLPDAG